MPIDPNIALSSTQLNPLQAAQLAGQRLQLQQGRQGIADQNALRALFAAPGAVDAQGMPTQNTLARLTQMNPEEGMKLRGQMLDLQLGKSGLSEKQWKAGVDAAAGAKELYDQQIDQGVSPMQAQRNAQVLYSQNMKQLAQSGLLSPDQIAMLQPNFDPQRVASNMEMLKFREQRRENQQRFGMEGARLGMEQKFHADELGLQRDRLKWEIESGRGDKQQVLMDPVNKDAAGNPTPYVYDMTKHKAFTLGGEPYAPGGAAKMASNTGGTATLSEDDANRLADQRIAGDKTALSGLGFGNLGAENRAMVQHALTRKLKASGLTGADLAAKTAEYMGLESGERALGTRSANLGMAANEASSFAPMVLSASERVNRTQFPTLNAMRNALDKGTGGEDIVRLIDSVNAFKNAYAQVVTRGSQSTDDARKRADEVMSVAWSKGQIGAGMDQLLQEIDIAKGAPSATQDELRQMFKHAQGGGRPTEGAAPAAETAAPEPLPMVTQDGKQVPDASKLKDGQTYTLPDGRRAKFDEKRMGFSVVQN